MKIALIGYGKMGHIIEEIAKSRGHEVVCAIDIQNQEDFDSEAFRSADVAIEFTTPKTCLGNVRKCLDRGMTVVVGSTGWYDELPRVKEEVAKADGSLFWASNFSIGINIFVAMQKFVARIMNRYPQYDVNLAETHHIHKLDSPSGTAITLAGAITDNLDRKQMNSDTPLLANIKAPIWWCDTSTTLLYEETPFHPERLLENLIAILHPELGIKPENEYFKKLTTR